MLTIGFNVIYFTSKNGFEEREILLCVNLKGGNDNWGLMWYREGGGWKERELDIEQEGEEEDGVWKESLLT
jgi:hypothetical protein